MADIVTSRASVPVLPKNQGLVLETAAPANGDDLLVPAPPAPPMRDVVCSPSDAVTALNSIGDGAYPGQRMKLHVVNANTLRVPSALGNVNLAADADATLSNPVALLWTGSEWIQD